MPNGLFYLNFWTGPFQEEGVSGYFIIIIIITMFNTNSYV